VTRELTPEQQERLSALDAAHRVALGDEELGADAIIDMARYIVTGRRPPWPPTYYSDDSVELHSYESDEPVVLWKAPQP